MKTSEGHESFHKISLPCWKGTWEAALLLLQCWVVLWRGAQDLRLAWLLKNVKP